MSLEADLVKLLVGPHSAATGAYEDRVYADYAPAATAYPCLVYEHDFEDPDIAWDGDTGYAVHNYTLTLMAEDKADTISDTTHLKATLQGFAGTSFDTGAATTALTTTFLLIKVSPSTSYYDEERNLYIRELDLELHTTT